MAEIFDKFLEWTQKHRERRTYEGYLDYIQGFTNHLGDMATMPAANLKPFHVVEWVDSHDGWNDTTRRNAIIHVQRPFNWASKIGHLPENPIRHIEKPQAKRRDNPVTPEDFAVLLSKVKEGDSFRDLLEFNWHAGVRPQEARLIEHHHVHLDAECIVIPKEEAKGKKRPRVIHLHGRSLAIIARLLKSYPSGKLFRNADGNPWKSFAICNRFGRLNVAVAMDDLKRKSSRGTQRVRSPCPTLLVRRWRWGRVTNASHRRSASRRLFPRYEMRPRLRRARQFFEQSFELQ